MKPLLVYIEDRSDGARRGGKKNAGLTPKDQTRDHEWLILGDA